MTDLVPVYSTTRHENARARRAMIDYIAARMAYQKGRTWSRMTDARREQMRSQVRACLTALCFAPTAMIEAESFIAVGASEEVADGADATTVANHTEAYLRELLR